MNIPNKIMELNLSEIDNVSGGVGSAAAGAAAAIVGVGVAAFQIGYSIGRDIGKAIFGNE